MTSTTLSVSQRPFMGATPYQDGAGAGVTFRVWAPFAQQVTVAGQFNNWSTNANALSSERNGYWSVDVPGATVGQHYKFVVFHPADNPLWRMDPYARSILHDANGNLNGLIASSGESYTTPGYATPAWNELVIYELHIGTFTQGGGINGGGSFASAIAKLNYLKDLGITAIEILPLGEFIGDISSGYNPAYIFAIEDEFGGPDGFRQFVNAAHQVGIAVIVDVVYNHLGVSAGDMWDFDGWSENGKGGIYFYNDWRSSTDWGDTRFDYGRGEVRQYLRDNALRWLEERFADGLRWDSVGSIRNVFDRNNDPAHDIADGWSLLQWINSLIAQRQPWKISIAEDMKDNEWITRDAGEGGADFNAQWGAGFVSTVRTAIIGSDDNARDMYAVSTIIGQTYNNDAFQRVIFTESHDADSNGAQRVPEMIWPGKADSWFSKKRSTLGAALVLTAPGIPMLFMGQEFLSWGYFDPSQPLDWSHADTFAGIVQLYRDLIHLRRNWFNTTRGLRGQHTHIHHSNNAEKVIAFHRWDQGGNGDDVLVVLNFGNRGYPYYTIGFPRSGHWQVRLNSDWTGYDASFGNWFSYGTDANGPPQDGMPTSGNVGLGPYSAIILPQD
jgi:1,4-alpha-glucan branching enzyme